MADISLGERLSEAGKNDEGEQEQGAGAAAGAGECAQERFLQLVCAQAGGRPARSVPARETLCEEWRETVGGWPGVEG